MTLSFGLGLPIVQQVPGRARAWEASAGGPELIRIARHADRLGFAHVSCSDHVVVPRSRASVMGTPWYDVAVTLAFLAGVTRRIRLLSHVLVLPYRHPLVTAKAFGTLDRLSNGRVILGVGSGHVKSEFRVLGVPYERRGALTDEYLQALREAWSHELAAFAGRDVAFEDVIVDPRPLERSPESASPRIWIGGNSRAAVRRAARYGDGWIPWEIAPSAFAALAAEGRDIAVACGRRIALDFIAPLTVALGDEATTVLERIEEWRRAGATEFHVGIAHRTLEDFLARIEWFASEIMLQFAD